MTLTRRQKQILDYVTEHMRSYVYAPTLSEIGRAVGIGSPSTVFAHLQKLEERGFIRRRWNQHRSIELVARADGKCPSCAVAVTTEQPEARA